ncbi:hypothetical protein R1flu_028929 [Riccia fluitans]|uniref:RING-type E3 ubiquitin transferase BRCA1 n=1 Tax=Riccia fluitans TaxID=41844 RepID=A0ABD1XN44_9MARC
MCGFEKKMNFFGQAESTRLTAEGRSWSSAKSYAAEYSGHSDFDPGNHGENHIPGMEAVIVTVSGYDSVTRTKLVKLIVHIGASNTGSLSSGNTHVVCWKFAGRKYELAKKLRRKIISHRWFEECLKAGALVPEEPYINKSGLEEAPFSWDDSGIGSPRSKASRKADSTIDLPSSACQPGNSTAFYGGSVREESLSARTTTLPDVDQSGTSRKVPARPKKDVSSRPGFQTISSDQGLSSDLSVKASQELVEDGCKRIAKSSVNRAPMGFRREKDVAVSASMRSPFTDQSNEVRHQNDTGYVPRVFSTEVGQQRQTYFPYLQRYGSAGYLVHTADYAQLRMRRKKEVDVQSGVEKYRRTMHGAAVPRSDELTFGDKEAWNASRAYRAEHVERPIPSRQIAVQGDEVDDQRDTNLLAERGGVALAVSSSPPCKDIACVICHTETKPTTEGLLGCGHRYCYPCIQKWADEATSKESTCPLCKASFEFITIRELQRSADDGICTQVLDERVVLVGRRIRQGQKIHLPSPGTEDVCIMCDSRDSPENLMSCTNCHQRSCHTFCLDPPALPGSSWSCNRCAHIRSRGLLRETLLSRFST